MMRRSFDYRLTPPDEPPWTCPDCGDELQENGMGEEVCARCTSALCPECGLERERDEFAPGGYSCPLCDS